MRVAPRSCSAALFTGLLLLPTRCWSFGLRHPPLVVHRRHPQPCGFCQWQGRPLTTAGLLAEHDSYDDVDRQLHLNNHDTNVEEWSDNDNKMKPMILPILQAALLIAGTTVGGGFLALPQTVVVPLGGFPPAASALVMVWIFLACSSWSLCDGLIARAKGRQEDEEGTMGIVALAQYAFATSSSDTKNESHRWSSSWIPTLVSWLLILVTQATLVSQLARAGILYQSLLGANRVRTMVQYRIGCVVAAVLGAMLTFGRWPTYDLDFRHDDPVNMDHQRSTTTNNSSYTTFATTSNAILTTLFLVSAVLLFHAGNKTAVWTRCLSTTATTNHGSSTILGAIFKALPIMLQLMVYGEILPTVCAMLQYQRTSIQIALAVGSTLPLLLLAGWAALGVALLPPTTIMGGSAVVDPVTILLHGSNNGQVQRRLVVLAVSAIGSTIVGSYLALQSAFLDIFGKRRKQPSSPQTATPWWRQAPPMIPAVVLPPLAISLLSPKLFLAALEFAGAYPVLLLYGVLPPLVANRIHNNDNKKTEKGSMGFGLVSFSLVVAYALGHVRQLFKWWFM